MKGSTDIVSVLSSPAQVYSHLSFIRCEQLHELFSLCYHEKWVRNPLLPPATKLRQGNVFTRVCDSVHRRGEGVFVRETLLDRDPPNRDPSWTENPPRMDRDPPYGQKPPGQRPDRQKPPPCMVTSGRYASYWNAFLLNFSIHAKV